MRAAYPSTKVLALARALQWYGGIWNSVDYWELLCYSYVRVTGTMHRVRLYNGQWHCCACTLTLFYLISQVGFPGCVCLHLSCVVASAPLSEMCCIPCKVIAHYVHPPCCLTKKIIPFEEQGALQEGGLVLGKQHHPQLPHAVHSAILNISIDNTRPQMHWI